MVGASQVRKRSVTINGLRTSISIEDEFWAWIKLMADEQNQPMQKFIEMKGADRKHGNFSSFLRTLILKDVQDRLTASRAQNRELQSQLAAAETMLRPSRG